jgi:hypothetical protein
MFIALHVNLHKLDLFELELGLHSKQIIQNFEAILHGVGSGARSRFSRVLEHLRSIDVVAANADNLLFKSLHILENTVVHYINAEIVFYIDFLQFFIKLDVVNSTHKLNRML